MIRKISPAKDWSRVPVVISFAALLCTALTAGFFVERTTGRPFQSSSSQLQQLEGQGNRGLEKRNGDADYDYDYDDYDNEPLTPLPPQFTEDPTSEPGCFRHVSVTRNYYTIENGKQVLRNYTVVVRECCEGFTGVECDETINEPFTPLPPQFTEDPSSEPGCFRHVSVTRNYYTIENGTRVLRNYTVVVRECCEGFTGVECNERIKTPPLNCSNLVCEGNPEAFCAVVTKCGRSIPFFMMPDGELAKCDNGQPSDESSFDNCT